jgi:hypothetical protein
MEYLDKKYLFNNLHRGDILFITRAVIKPNGKNYTYDTVRKVLMGQFKNERIIKFAEKYLKMKEELVEAAKQSV